MSEQTNYCTLKGFGWAMLLIVFLMVVAPLLMMLAIQGPEDYGRNCVRSIAMPCLGLSQD